MINNAVYSELGDRWYGARDDPIALLRAESRFRNPWVIENLRAQGAEAILDVGCGGGFLSNPLAEAGFRVTGVDQSHEALSIARQHDTTGSVRYVRSDAFHLPFADHSFDAVTAMDFLEHVDDPARVIREAARLLKPGGTFFFYTFNRNPLSHLIVIKGVEWFVRNTPRDLHVIDLFIKPTELRGYLADAGLSIETVRGTGPRVFSWAFLRLLLTGQVSDDFAFDFAPHTWMSYIGHATRHHP